MSLQACSNVTLEDVAVLGECCPSGRNFSLNLLVLAFISGAVPLSQVDVAVSVLDLGVVSIWCISAYEYVAGEVKITKIFAVYPDVSNFSNQSSKYAFECICRRPLGRYGMSWC